MLEYNWICPENLEALCAGQHTPEFYIPWKSVIQVPALKFSNIYSFAVDITWNMPDGEKQIKTARIEAQWYNLQKPKFEIAPEPAQPIATGVQPTVFGIKGTNFDQSSTDMTIYKITWDIKPEIKKDAITISDDGQFFSVAAGNWPEDSSYEISAELIFIEQPNINNTESLKFNIYAPPKNGSIEINPPHGYFTETTFLVSV